MISTSCDTTEYVQCPECGATLPPGEAEAMLPLLEMFGPAAFKRACFCDTCDKARLSEINAERQNAERRNAEVLASRIIPPAYAENARRIPKPSTPILAYDFPGGKNLGIAGPSGTYKSTIAYEIMRQRLMDGTFKTAAVIVGPDFSTTVLRQFGDNGADKDAAANSIHHAKKADILYIDDLDKIRPTPTAVSALLSILEARTGHHRPFIYSTQANGATLLKMFATACPADDTAPSAIVRRLMEQTRHITTSR